MKSLLLAGAMIVATGTLAFAQGAYWVVGDRATAKCEIVTSNPVSCKPTRSVDPSGSEVDRTSRLTTPSWRVRPSANVRPWKNRPPRRRIKKDKSNSVHGIAAASHSVEAYRRVDLRQFRFKLLIDAAATP